MHFDYWQLLAGIGILTFWMRIFEGAIRTLWGGKLKGIIKKYTDTGWKSIFTGFWTTSFLQSSTLLSLLILAFAGAGILALKSGIWLLLWANVWSPMLPLLAALIGFGEFKISAFALPIIAVGGISLIFLKSEKRQQVAKMMVWFWLLFLWLDFMKGSVDALQEQFWIEQFKHLSLWGFGLLWFILTIMISSSGAVSILTLAALDGGIISFPAAVAIWRGATIGTTFPAVLGSLGGSRIKTQLAASHVLFNVLSVVISLIFFWQYIRFTNEFLWFKDNLVMGNAILNVIFDASTAIFLWLFLNQFTKFIVWIFPNKDDDVTRLKVLDATIKWQKRGAAFASAKLYALHEDCKTLINHAATYNAYLFGRNMKDIYILKNSKKSIEATGRDKTKHKEMYAECKKIGDVMLEHLLPLKQEKLSKEIRKIAEHIETTIYCSTKSVKATKNIYRDIQNMKDSESKTLQQIYKTFSEQSKEFFIYVASITEKEHTKKNFQELKTALQKIETYHIGFIEMVTTLINKKAKPEDIDIPSLINVDHYIYRSAKTMVKALQKTYLADEEERIFDEMNDQEEK